ncbi:MAG: hypothetical protein HY060_07825, partial [Proteobacteria bacterium]|nr:hypothetical protein [Pseudomonadota bacterium]
HAAAAADIHPGAEWTHVDPGPAGWSIEGLAKARAFSEKVGATAVMVIHHGAVIAEWGDTAVKSNLHSVRKSLLSVPPRRRCWSVVVDGPRVELYDEIDVLEIEGRVVRD